MPRLHQDTCIPDSLQVVSTLIYPFVSLVAINVSCIGDKIVVTATCIHLLVACLGYLYRRLHISGVNAASRLVVQGASEVVHMTRD